MKTLTPKEVAQALWDFDSDEQVKMLNELAEIVKKEDPLMANWFHQARAVMHDGKVSENTKFMFNLLTLKRITP